MLICISFFLLLTFIGAMGSVCQSDASMSSLTTGCISSSFLHMDSDRLVKVGLLYLKDDVSLFQTGYTIWFVGWWRKWGFHLPGCLLGSLPKAEQPRAGCEVEGIICWFFPNATLLLVRWEGPGEEGVVCGCLDHLPQQDKIGPQVLTTTQCNCNVSLGLLQSHM